MWERKAHVVGVSDGALEGRGPREPQLALLSIPVWAPPAQLALQHPYPPPGFRLCSVVLFHVISKGSQGVWVGLCLPILQPRSRHTR